jgi:tol-pal system protein YbgF
MRVWTVVGALAVLGASGCATKKDLKNLRTEMLALQAHQDSLFRETQRQNRLMLDTIRASFSLQMDAQGQTSHRFQQLEAQLGRTEAILEQLQLAMANFTDRLDAQMARAATGAAGATGGNNPNPISAGEADDAFNEATRKMGEGAFTTARSLFEFFLERFPSDLRAPEAQFQIAQTWAAEANYERAITEFQKVESMWSTSARAPEALLQAGIIAEEQLSDRDRARQFYLDVTRRFPNTEAYNEATRRLNRRG